jgi:molecular chaperone GrpE (heat shock protein)
MPPPKIKITDEFASTMQQLSAEAQKTMVSEGGADSGASEKQAALMLQEIRALNTRVQSLEQSLLTRLDKPPVAPGGELQEQLRKMDEHMVALRNTETVNQRLFDSLHEELIKYRDNFLHESLQKPFIRDLVVLFDDLNSLHAQLQSAGAAGDGARGPMAHWSENLENSIHSLVEVLHRLEVNQIEPKDKVDRALHRVVSYEPADFAEDDERIVMRVKRGFLWRDQVLRPEEVVAKRYS